MKRWLVPLVVVLVATAGLLWVGRDSSPARPHVILISIDTLRADHLGCYGYGRNTSPAIDRLAGRCVRFVNAFSPSSWTLPAHMSLHTSQYPHVHGVEDGLLALHDESTTLAEVLKRAGYRTSAFISWAYLESKYGFGQGFDEYHELLPPKDQIDSTTRAAFKAQRVTDEVIAWLDQGQDEPVFLFVHYFDPHIDYAPPPPYDTLFDADYQGQASGSFFWVRPHIKGLHGTTPGLDPRDVEHLEALYDGEIRYTDTHVGRLLEAIDARLGLDNCLLILASDHGEEFNDHGSLEGHQWTLYEEIIHIPMLVGLPDRAHAGTVVNTPVGLVDVAATILDCLDLPPEPSFQGRSLVGLMGADEPAAAETLVYSETRRFNIKQSVRGARFKLIYTQDTKVNRFGIPIVAGFELYDLLEDPSERKNIFDLANPVARSLASRLDALRQSRASAGPSGPGPPVPLSQEDLDRLRSLGYVQ